MSKDGFKITFSKLAMIIGLFVLLTAIFLEGGEDDTVIPVQKEQPTASGKLEGSVSSLQNPVSRVATIQGRRYNVLD